MVNAFSLVGTGIALGFFHVLTGPDHLSALATLSANVNSVQAFLLGVRWGVGHSTGLLLVGLVFILLSLKDETAQTVDVPDRVSRFFESLVGVFMIMLGIYGIKRAWNGRPKIYGAISNVNTTEPDSLIAGDPVDQDCGIGEVEIINSPSYHDHVHSPLPGFQSDSNDGNTSVGDTSSCGRKVSAKSLAVLAGIIHGLAGPGGVLGVVPAVQLHSARLAATYLLSFCISSTFTMGCFAATYGTCSSRLTGSQGQVQRRKFIIESISASASLVIGVTWLILLSIGKLEDVFP